jgi:hypothetical protein
VNVGMIRAPPGTSAGLCLSGDKKGEFR